MVNVPWRRHNGDIVGENGSSLVEYMLLLCSISIVSIVSISGVGLSTAKVLGCAEKSLAADHCLNDGNSMSGGSKSGGSAGSGSNGGGAGGKDGK